MSDADDRSTPDAEGEGGASATPDSSPADATPDDWRSVYEDGSTNVAVACQGGGSHTAFAAGVLRGLFHDWDPEHRLVGLSGTSGGALCAVAAWYGLVADGHDPRERLKHLWDDLAASDPAQQWANDALVWGSRVANAGAPVPEFSPYQTPAAGLASESLRAAIENTVDFERLRSLAGPPAPRLAVGTVDVNGGEFESFCDAEMTPEAVLASAAVPDLFEAVEINGHYHWDGLFSHNPPIDDLLTVDADRKPDELWVVQINPQERAGEPTSLLEIRDRRNELAGNISLNQELRFVERVNDWVEAGHLPESDYSHTEVRRIELDAELHCSTKLDRSPAFLSELMRSGQDRAREFLEG